MNELKTSPAQSGGNSALRIVVIVLAVIGAVAVVGVGAMALMHGTMMGGMGMGMGEMRTMMAGMRC